MNIQQLHNCLILSRKLHFTQAAEEINIVQPALSSQIKQLESDLKADLFRRNKKSMIQYARDNDISTKVEEDVVNMFEYYNEISQ